MAAEKGVPYGAQGQLTFFGKALRFVFPLNGVFPRLPNRHLDAYLETNRALGDTSCPTASRTNHIPSGRFSAGLSNGFISPAEDALLQVT